MPPLPKVLPQKTNNTHDISLPLAYEFSIFSEKKYEKRNFNTVFPKPILFPKNLLRACEIYNGGLRHIPFSKMTRWWGKKHTFTRESISTTKGYVMVFCSRKKLEQQKNSLNLLRRGGRRDPKIKKKIRKQGAEIHFSQHRGEKANKKDLLTRRELLKFKKWTYL